jgi:NADPH-dependent glutamate synthase beta subunit-like oxidoreductase/NAD-dependent dihydropyrimidine dehydrogenase PreA subunit
MSPLAPPDSAGAARVDRPGSAGILIPELRADALPIRAIEPSPCSHACPAGIHVKAYVSLIAEGRFEEALAVVREQCPLPGVCGRVCTHPCETACRRAEWDEPVSIRALKRFVADLGLEHEPPPPPPVAPRPERVAVIGSGPAGLTAAHDLARAGHPVTVFEAAPEPGGMLRYGIAAYRLPREVLESEIAQLRRAGVDLQTGCALGTDIEIEDLMSQGYSAVVLAVGAQLGRRAGLDGGEPAGVEDALGYLRAVSAGERPRTGRKVTVIGGGSTAIEAARTALRLGAASVEILYRRTRNEAPADEEEWIAAEREGVRFRFLIAPYRAVVEDGHLAALECRHVELGEPDASGRRRPVVIPESYVRVETDHLLAAIGQSADLSFLPSQLRTHLDLEGLLDAEPESGMTRVAGVFAAGDVVTGPATVVEAIGAGHRVASAVQRYFAKRDEEEPLYVPRPWQALEYGLDDEPPETAERRHPAVRDLTPGAEFEEVEQAFTREDAMREAQRCLRCGPCDECHVCVPSCGRRHVVLRDGLGGEGGAPFFLRAPVSLAAALDGQTNTRSAFIHEGSGPERGDPWATELFPLRFHVEPERCRGCGECVEVCPFDAVGLTAREGTRESRALVDAFACRGCGLCGGVCPTGAITSYLDLAKLQTEAREEPARSGCVLVTCRRRASLHPSDPLAEDPDVEVVTLPCIGSLDSGTLIDLVRTHDGPVFVSGCATDHCRYERGATIASRRVHQASSFLDMFDGNSNRLVSLFSDDPLVSIPNPQAEAHRVTPDARPEDDTETQSDGEVGHAPRG